MTSVADVGGVGVDVGGLEGVVGDDAAGGEPDAFGMFGGEGAGGAAGFGGVEPRAVGKVGGEFPFHGVGGGERHVELDFEARGVGGAGEGVGVFLDLDVADVEGRGVGGVKILRGTVGGVPKVEEMGLHGVVAQREVGGKGEG